MPRGGFQHDLVLGLANILEELTGERGELEVGSLAAEISVTLGGFDEPEA